MCASKSTDGVNPHFAHNVSIYMYMYMYIMPVAHAYSIIHVHTCTCIYRVPQYVHCIYNNIYIYNTLYIIYTYVQCSSNRGGSPECCGVSRSVSECSGEGKGRGDTAVLSRGRSDISGTFSTTDGGTTPTSGTV